jgi:protein involved in polysaccharide export with SLBB domain
LNSTSWRSVSSSSRMVKSSLYFRFALMWLCLVTMASAGYAQDSGTARGSLRMSCRQIAVSGTVRHPSLLEVRSRMRLIEVLARVGGPTERAGKIIRVVHSCNCSPCSEVEIKAQGIQEYNLAGVLRGRERGNPYVAPGDIVVVVGADSVFVVGNVRKTEMVFVEGMTMMRAIELAGGVRMSDLVAIRIHRSSIGGPRRDPIIVSLRAIREQRAEDLMLEPWDIVEVSDELGHFQLPKLSNPAWDPPLFPRKDNSGL